MGRGASSPSSAEGLPGGLPSPVSARGLVPSFKNLSRGTASRPLLSQPVLAGFSKVCSCLLPAQPHPRPGPAVRPAGFTYDASAPSGAHSSGTFGFPLCSRGRFAKLGSSKRTLRLRLLPPPIPGAPASHTPSTRSSLSQRAGGSHPCLVFLPDHVVRGRPAGGAR